MDSKEKMAVIAGASKALELKGKNPRLSDSEILKEIMENADRIVEGIDETL